MKHSGEHVPPGHPMTTFATTYSHQFVKASAELYRLYSKLYPNLATHKLYVAFRESGVPACRSERMTFAKVEYLVKRRIIPFLYPPP